MLTTKNKVIRRLSVLLFSVFMGVTVLSVAGCGDKDEGVAEKAGHQIDKLTDNQGPAEKAGNKVDDAIDSLSEAAE